MNQKLSVKVAVGIFVFAALLIFSVMVFVLGDGTYFFKSSYNLKAKFSDISGLRLGSPVFLAGYNIGKVNEIVVPSSPEDLEFTVYLNLLADYQEKIREDSVAKIETQGLLGDKAISVSVGSASFKKLEDWDYVQVKEGVSLAVITEKGLKIVDEVDRVLSSVGEMVEDVKTKKSLVNALIYDPKGAQAIGDLVGISASAKKILSDLEKEKLPQKLSTSAKNVESMTKNLNEVSSKIERGEGSLGGLISDPTVYQDIKTLLGKANRSALIKAVIRHTLSKNEKQNLK